VRFLIEDVGEIEEKGVHVAPHDRRTSQIPLRESRAAWVLRTVMHSSFSSRLDHRKMVCNAKFTGSQARYLGNKDLLGIVTGLQ